MCVPKSNSNDRYAITCDVIAYHLVHFCSIRLINKCQSGIDFIFTSEHAIYSTFMKISVPSQVFRGKTKWKWCEVITLECQLCFRNNKIREFDTLERQTMGVNKYASTFPMASCNKETCNHRKKTWHKKIWKYAIVFAGTQLRITRLRKYPIDPKAYLGHCYIFPTFWKITVGGFVN